jgi:hypothetical protein
VSESGVSGVVMLNLFQHLSFQRINLEIPNLFRNDIESSPIVIASPDLFSSPPRDCFVAIAPRNDGGQGSPEGVPSGGGLGVYGHHPA